MNEVRPVIGYIGDEKHDYTHDSIPDRAAHVFLLRSDLGCQVVEVPYLDYDDVQGLDELVSAYERDLLIMLMTAEGTEYEDDDSTKIQIAAARERFGTNVPIVVFPQNQRGGSEEMRQQSPNTYSTRRDSTALKNFISDLVNNSTGLIRAKRRLVGPEMEALLHAHITNYGDDTEGTPDPNHRIVAEWLRCHMLPGELVKKEFDDTLERPVALPKMDNDVYLQEVESFRRMDDAQRLALEDEILERQGYQRDPRGGILVVRASKGSRVMGFAIDAETLMTVKISAFGMHAAAEGRLRNNLERLHKMKKLPKRERYDYRTVAGLIHVGLSNYQTPVVQLYEPNVPDPSVYNADFQRIGRHLLASKELIPIDAYGYLIDGSYRYKPCEDS